MSRLLFLIVLTFNLSTTTLGRDGFIKDQNEELIEFPPQTLQSYDSSIPVGHLRPLGWQRSPDGSVEELNVVPSPKEFYEKYVSQGKPVVFRSAISVQVPAMALWSKKNYLADKYGHIDVDVVVKKELMRKKGPKRMKFKKFLREYLYEDWYLTNFIPVEMMQELTLPDCLHCGFHKWLMESELWMSSGGTSSLLHSHADHDLHCLLAGRKDFIFVDRQHREHFDYVDEEPYEGAGHSMIDMDQINMFKYKKVMDIPWIYSILRKGDCVYVPAGYLHQVRSYGKSISSTNHFAPTPDLDLNDCLKKQNSEKSVSLNQANFLWTYADGKLMLTNSKLSASSMKFHLLKVMRDQPVLSRKLLEAFYEDVMEQTAHEYPDSNRVWKLLTSELAPDRNKSRPELSAGKGGDGKEEEDEEVRKKVDPIDSLTRKEVNDLPVKSLTRLADLFNSAQETAKPKKKSKKQKKVEL